VSTSRARSPSTRTSRPPLLPMRMWPYLRRDSRCNFLTKRRFRDLAERRGRQPLDELQAFRPLVPGDVAARQVGPNAIQADKALASGYDEGAAALTEPLVGHSHDGDSANTGVRHEQEFDLLRADLFAAAVDQVLDPAGMAVAEGAADRHGLHQVAGLVEAVRAEGHGVAFRRV